VRQRAATNSRVSRYWGDATSAACRSHSSARSRSACGVSDGIESLPLTRPPAAPRMTR
jgi:hypothetical protein